MHIVQMIAVGMIVLDELDGVERAHLHIHAIDQLRAAGWKVQVMREELRRTNSRGWVSLLEYATTPPQRLLDRGFFPFKSFVRTDFTELCRDIVKWEQQAIDASQAHT